MGEFLRSPILPYFLFLQSPSHPLYLCYDDRTLLYRGDAFEWIKQKCCSLGFLSLYCWSWLSMSFIICLAIMIRTCPGPSGVDVAIHRIVILPGAVGMSVIESDIDVAKQCWEWGLNNCSRSSWFCRPMFLYSSVRAKIESHVGVNYRECWITKSVIHTGSRCFR